MPFLVAQFDFTIMEQKLAAKSAKIKDMNAALEDVGVKLLEYFGDTVFQQNGIDTDWPMLAASTVRARTRRTGYYRNAPIAQNMTLVWTGRLKQGFRYSVSPNRLVIVNDVPYFRYHQRGSGLPKRTMLGVNQEVLDQATKIINDHVKS